jgi:hypothetical protein
MKIQIFFQLRLRFLRSFCCRSSAKSLFAVEKKSKISEFFSTAAKGFRLFFYRSRVRHFLGIHKKTLAAVEKKSEILEKKSTAAKGFRLFFAAVALAIFLASTKNP